MTEFMSPGIAVSHLAGAAHPGATEGARSVGSVCLAGVHVAAAGQGALPLAATHRGSTVGGARLGSERLKAPAHNDARHKIHLPADPGAPLDSSI